MQQHELSLLQVRGHCTFTCLSRATGWLVEVGGHCESCVEEVRRRGYVLSYLRPSDDLAGPLPGRPPWNEELVC